MNNYSYQVLDMKKSTPLLKTNIWEITCSGLSSDDFVIK